MLGFFVEMLKVIRYHWFSFGPKTFSYITGIVGNMLMVGAFQFVFANWCTMIKEGNRDNCYYNDFCYRVANHDIPFNLMISNLTYIFHGLILVVWVLILETKVNVRCQSGRDAVEATAMKKRYCFSIGYAFSWGLVFEGLFSTLYHFCPSRFTFQFDSAFMFIIAGLTVLLLYNGIEQNRCPSSENAKHPVGASNFFLFFIVPLFIFNYFGVLFNSNVGLNKVMQGFFFAFLVIWWLVMLFWAYYKLDMQQKICGGDCKDKFDALLFLLGGLIVPCGIFISLLFSDLAQMFLFACISCSFVAILAKSTLCKCKCECTCECAITLATVRSFYKVFSSLSPFSFCQQLLPFLKRYPPQTKRRHQKTLVTKTKNVSFLDFSTGMTCGIFYLPLLSLWVRLLSCL